jgi:hypothetical protein
MQKVRTIKDVFTTSFTIKFSLIIMIIISLIVNPVDSSFKMIFANLVSFLMFFISMYFIHSLLFHELSKRIKSKFKDKHIELDLTLYDFIDEKVILMLKNIMAIQYLCFEFIMMLIHKKPFITQILIYANSF